MKCDARVRGIVAMECSELLGSLGQPRHQHPESGFIPADPVAFQILRRERLEYIGCGVAPLYDKRAYRAEAMARRLADDLPRNTDPRADRLVQAFEARSCVQHIAERGIFQPGTGADIANHGNAGVNPDTGVAETDAARLRLGAERRANASIPMRR